MGPPGFRTQANNTNETPDISDTVDKMAENDKVLKGQLSSVKFRKLKYGGIRRK